MVNLYSKIKCYLCEETVLGREIGATIGNGLLGNNICNKCVHENYIWATGDELITDFEKEQRKKDMVVTNILYELGGVLTLDEIRHKRKRTTPRLLQ